MTRTRIFILIAIACLLGASLLAQASSANAGKVTAAKTWKFSGKGTKRLGTIRLRHTATLSWRKGRGTLRITGTRGFRLLETRSRRGHITVRKGTYRRLTASAVNSWQITIRERR